MIWKTYFCFVWPSLECFFACVKYRQLNYVTITMVIHNFCFNLPPESFLIYYYSRVLFFFFRSPSIARILREEGISELSCLQSNLDRSFVVYEFFPPLRIEASLNSFFFHLFTN